MGSANGDGSAEGDGSADGDGDGVGVGVGEGVCCREGVCCAEAKDSWRLKEVAGANKITSAREQIKNGKTLMLILKRIFPIEN